MGNVIFAVLRYALVALTGHGYDRSVRVNTLHHKLSYRLHKLLPKFGIVGLQRIDIPGLKGKHMYVRAEDGGVAHQLIMYCQYEPYESSLIREVLKPGMTVYDIGANLGYYVLLASECVGSTGKVFAFEPAPENLELLRRTVSENTTTNVTIHACAVGANDGEASLAISPTNSGDHQLREAADRAKVAVPVRSTDSLIAEGLPTADVVIMDVQGSELDAIRGMNSLLGTGSPKVIFTEFWQKGLNDRHPNGAREFLEVLTSVGFQLAIIDEKRKRVRPTTPDALLNETLGNEERNLLCTRA